jgi:hypothetical protein
MIRNRAKDGNRVMGRTTTFVLSSQTGIGIDNTLPAANYMVNPYPATFASLDEARNAIRMEMRLESAMEGFRFFDLVRWGIADKTLNDYITQDKAFRSLMTGASFTKGKNEYWPLPQTQVDLQPGVLTQNSGF